MNNVDPKKMAKDVEKAKLKASPMFNQIKDNYLGQRFQEVLQQEGLTPQQPPQGMAPQMGTPIPTGGQRGLVPPIREVAPIGSAQEIQNQIKARRKATSSGIVTQGRGGGGNR